MVDLSDLACPADGFRIMAWDEGKIDRLVDRMMKADMMVSDEKRNSWGIRKMLSDLFLQKDGPNLPYEYGDMDMVAIFAGIRPGGSCFLLLKIVNPDSFGK